MEEEGRSIWRRIVREGKKEACLRVKLSVVERREEERSNIGNSLSHTYRLFIIVLI